MGLEPLFSARFVVDLCGMGDEDYEAGAFHQDMLKGGAIEASSWNFQRANYIFASKIIVVLEVKQQSVATTSILDLNLGCVAIMEVVQSSGSALLKVFGGTIKASALGYHLASVEISGNATDIIEQDPTRIYCQTSCTCLSLSDGRLVEDAVFSLFGLCHRRWTTSPPLLIPRFNGGDTSSLSSVKVIPYLQLNSTPRVHFPDRPSGEPPAGHQLDRTLIEALEDCRCGNFESGLSTDDRTPYGFICDLRHLHEFRPSCCVVQLRTYVSCSTFESHVMMYCNP
jgi:hypothetical protein